MEAPNIEVVDNTSRTAADFINTELASAQSVFMASAFVKESGLRLIQGNLERLLEEDGDARLVTGLDFQITEPQAMRHLIRLAERHPQFVIRVFAKLKQSDVPAFHPKLYIFERSEGYSSFLAGSANLTGGGLHKNAEVNLAVRLAATDPLFSNVKRVHQGYLYAPKSSPINLELVSDYEHIYRKVRAAGRQVLQEPSVKQALRELQAKQRQLSSSATTQKGLIVEAIRDLRGPSKRWVSWTEIADWVESRARAQGLSFKWDTLRNSVRGRLNEHTVGKGGEDLFIRKGGIEGREGMYKLSDKGETFKGG